MRKLLLLGCMAVGITAGASVGHAQMTSQTASSSYGGMVVTNQHIASQVGRLVLDAGGNAVDAAVAIGYALAVVDPCCGNLGGGGFMTIHLQDGRETFINFRERAPLAATPTLFQDGDGNVIPNLSLYGYLAAGIPGSVAGLEKARGEYGTKSRLALIAPAIALAELGFVLDQGDIVEPGAATDLFARQPNVAAIFLNNGQPYKVGERLVQKNWRELWSGLPSAARTPSTREPSPMRWLPRARRTAGS